MRSGGAAGLGCGGAQLGRSKHGFGHNSPGSANGVRVGPEWTFARAGGVIFRKLSRRERACATRPIQTNTTCFVKRSCPAQSDAVSRGGAMDTTSENQAATVRDQEGLPLRVFRRGEAVRPLPPHARSLADLALDVGEVRRSLSNYMTRSRTVGLLILKDGEVALERYGIGAARSVAGRATRPRSR